MPPDLEPRTPGGAHQGTGDRRLRNGNEEKGCEEDHQEEGREEVTRFQDNSGRSWKGPVATPALFLWERVGELTRRWKPPRRIFLKRTENRDLDLVGEIDPERARPRGRLPHVLAE